MSTSIQEMQWVLRAQRGDREALEALPSVTINAETAENAELPVGSGFSRIRGCAAL